MADAFNRLEEMFEIGDWVTVLRDGGLSEAGPISDYDEDRLITAMVGREISTRRNCPCRFVIR